MRKMMLLLVGLALVGWSGCQNNADDNENDNENVANANDNSSEPGNENGNDNTAGAGGTDPESGVAELSRFESEDELEEYFEGQILAQNSRFDGFFRGEDVDFAEEPALEGGDENDSADAAPAPPAPGGDGADQAAGEATGGDDDGFSQTTIQEEGVDEADVVKTDGEYIYVMSGEELRIVKATPATELALVSTFQLEGYGRDLYLVGDLAVTLTESHGGFYGEGIVDVAVGTDSDSVPDQASSNSTDEPVTVEDQPGETDAEPPEEESDGVGEDEEPDIAVIAPYPGEWYRPRPQTIVTIIDVTDQAAPVQASQTAFDGSIASSRMIDGVLRLVLANYSDYYYDVLPLGAAEDELALEELDVDALLPDFQTTDEDGEVTTGNIVEWDAFFRPVDPDGFGVTTVITLDTAAPKEFDAVAIVAEPGLIYASTKALYLTDTEWYYDYRRTETDIYKLEFLPDTVALVAAGTVPGRILNQYSMSEYEGYLRVATTTDGLWRWESDEQIPSTNSVYVMDEVDGGLAVVGSIEDLAVTEEIQSARFVGPRGYVVTFRRIDPLFTLDLSNPQNPQVVGELKVPGFSTFIVPMDDDHLLTVGEYVDPEGWGGSDGVQLSIFDVSNFASPQLSANVVIPGASSEATYNPKAFTYFASGDVLALPIEYWGRGWWDGDDGIGVEEGEGVAVALQAPTPPFEEGDEFFGLFVYGVTAEGGFDYQGRLSTTIDEDGWWWGSFTRGVFIGDQVYAVTSEVVATAPVADVDTVTAAIALSEHDNEPKPGGPPIVEPAPDPDLDDGPEETTSGSSG